MTVSGAVAQSGTIAGIKIAQEIDLCILGSSEIDPCSRGLALGVAKQAVNAAED